ncbi:MAG: radical SAM protein [Actinomycetota bacterium]
MQERLRVHLVQPYHPSNVKMYGKMYMSQLTLPIVAALMPSDVEVTIKDENVEPLDFDNGFDLVGITALTPTATRAYEIAHEYRRRGVPVILGGLHPSLFPAEASQHADAVLIGEAEGIWEEMLADFRAGKLKKFYQSTERPDLANLPLPRRDLSNNGAYVNIPKVETSRGCPFDCSFCSTTVFFGRKIRYRPVNDVVNELKEIKPSFVFFTDNNIVGNAKYAKELFRALIPLKIKWLSQGSLNFVRDDELLRLARDSGCVGMLIGFESLSPAAIEGMGKRVNRVEEYGQAVKKLHRHRIGTIGCFVFGFDEDDEGLFKRTVKFVRRYNVDTPQFTVLTPYPGTALRESLEKEGRILHNKWEKYDSTTLVFKPKILPPNEFREKFTWAGWKVYSWPAIIGRILRSLLYMRSFYRAFVFLQINMVYRKLFQVGLEHQEPFD